MPRLPLLVSLLLLTGCGTGLPNDPPPKVVMAVFDPSRAEIPSPTDLAMAEGKVAIALSDLSPAADNELKALLNGKDGFSTASSTKVRFSGSMSAASFTSSSVVVLDLGRVGEQSPTVPFLVNLQYQECDRSLTLNAPDGFHHGHRYLFAVRGEGAVDAVKGADGEPLVPSPVFYFLRAGKDLRQHPEAFPGTRAQKAATAGQLERVRQSFEPLFAVLEQHGLPRREVAVLWSFTALSSGEAYFDPASKRVPMPNDLLRDPVTGRVTLPIDPGEDATQQNLKRGFNQLDGFATTGSLTLDFSRPLARESVVLGQTVRVFRPDTLEEKTDFVLRLSDDAKKLSLEPQTPLWPATRYVVVVGGLRDSLENPVGGMPLSNLLTLRNPLLDEAGKSTISSLCDAQAATLEPLRAAMAPVLDEVSKSLPRESLAAAWTFTTQDILARAQELYAAPYQQSLPLTVKNVVSKTPLELALPIGAFSCPTKLISDVSRVITGKMVTWERQDRTTGAFRENGAGMQREIDFLLTLPKGLAAGQKVPVVIFGHGLHTERRLGLLLADKLADAGFAMIAIDFPGHGDRSVCLEDSHCSAGGTCAADRSCVKNGLPVDLARVNGLKFGDTQIDLPLPPSWGGGTPTSTGASFVDVANLLASRDHFRQSLIDLSALIRLIRKMDWRATTGGFQLDPEAIHYVGISLGGIIGGAAAASEPSLGSMLLNVAGAGLPDLMEDSSFFGPALEEGLAAKGILKGKPEYYAFKSAARWALDEVDPINLAAYGTFLPRAYVDPESGEARQAPAKRLRVQMALGDVIVPNNSTDRLVAAGRVDRTTGFRSFVGSHGFLANPVETIACIAGQADMADFLEGKK